MQFKKLVNQDGSGIVGRWPVGGTTEIYPYTGVRRVNLKFCGYCTASFPSAYLSE